MMSSDNTPFPTMQIQFPDRIVSYDVFLSDLSARIAEKLLSIREQPEVISQRAAYREFGKTNVQRWLRQGKLHPRKRIGKVEYSTAELRMAQQVQQDYFK